MFVDHFSYDSENFSPITDSILDSIIKLQSTGIENPLDTPVDFNNRAEVRKYYEKRCKYTTGELSSESDYIEVVVDIDIFYCNLSTADDEFLEKIVGGYIQTFFARIDIGKYIEKK